MKYIDKIKKGAAIVLLGAFSFTSCVNDLDQLPIDPNESTAETVYTTEEGYNQVVAKIYAALALTGQEGPAGNGDVGGIDEGSSSFIRNLWNAQVLTTDEAICAWGDFGISQLNQLQYSAANPFIEGLYYRIYHQVSMANEFLRQSTDEMLASRGQEDLQDKMKVLRAEVRFLRAYAYSCAVDLFGNVPFVLEEDGLGTYLPEQIMRKDLFNWLIEELDAIEGEIGTVGTAAYGRVDEGAVAFLKARLYLNAEVYTGTAMWDKVITETNKVIAGYSLYTGNYQHLFYADNNKADIASGFIFAVPYDGDQMQTYGGTTFLAFSATGGGISPAEVGLSGGWGGNRARPQLVGLFPTGDNRGTAEERVVHSYYTFEKNDSLLTDTVISGFAGTLWNSATYTEKIWDENEDGSFTFREEKEVEAGGLLENENPANYTDGYGVMKFRNINSDGANPANQDFVTTDFPLFRLADAYLMYAEANINGGGGDANTAVNYINQLRERAFGDTSGNITLSNLTKDFIIDERGRELFWEGTRRSDLIRFSKYTTNDYLWSWKGGVSNGAAVSTTKRLFAIPAKDIGANTKLVQNPGY
ncbi:RagB/SusD family nutrient uptake outer membrane protein [Saccharicrinis aurantiacus]|uniref:RagB/SusD family nutrient uptake outer membrane protein n=1 Tax=Saccharicrinis aurantiacus TaxID=1849719 RepID=UPI00094FB0E5|nr:RagB/SusD family nutrient uptake outer membrane protein [Saccharicrinis aurantiacus]